MIVNIYLTGMNILKIKDNFKSSARNVSDLIMVNIQRSICHYERCLCNLKILLPIYLT